MTVVIWVMYIWMVIHIIEKRPISTVGYNYSAFDVHPLKATQVWGPQALAGESEGGVEVQ